MSESPIKVLSASDGVEKSQQIGSRKSRWLIYGLTYLLILGLLFLLGVPETLIETLASSGVTILGIVTFGNGVEHYTKRP